MAKGRGLYKRTKKHREKMRKSLMGLMVGENHPLFGTHVSEESKEKMRKTLGNKLNGKNNPFFGRKHSEETKEKMRLARLGKKHSEETRRKMREFRLGKVYPNFNTEACKRIDEYGKKHGYNFQHALNGGEIHVIGYSLDGYDKEKNVVVEYYEHAHRKTMERDAKRKAEIVARLGCKFIELWER